MRIGLNTDGVRHLSLTQTLDLAAELGLDYLEFATGAWSSAPHLDLDAMLASASARQALQDQLADRNLRISALTCSGNPLDPGPSGAEHDTTTRKTIELASLLGVDRVVLMSGLPAGPGDRHPNWVVVSWPPEAAELLNGSGRPRSSPTGRTWSATPTSAASTSCAWNCTPSRSSTTSPPSSGSVTPSAPPSAPTSTPAT